MVEPTAAVNGPQHEQRPRSPYSPLPTLALSAPAPPLNHPTSSTQDSPTSSGSEGVPARSCAEPLSSPGGSSVSSATPRASPARFAGGAPAAATAPHQGRAAAAAGPQRCSVRLASSRQQASAAASAVRPAAPRAPQWPAAQATGATPAALVAPCTAGPTVVVRRAAIRSAPALALSRAASCPSQGVAAAAWPPARGVVPAARPTATGGAERGNGGAGVPAASAAAAFVPCAPIGRAAVAVFVAPALALDAPEGRPIIRSIRSAPVPQGPPTPDALWAELLSGGRAAVAAAGPSVMYDLAECEATALWMRAARFREAHAPGAAAQAGLTPDDF
jgi:hypothetical protein